MDTLKRMKSLRRSTYRRKSAAKSGFVITLSDIALDFSNLFQPNMIVASITRHKSVEKSATAPWEPSLKSPKQGFCFWHPAFEVTLQVSGMDESATDHSTPRKQGAYSQGHHKDVYIAVENVNAKGRRKLLAKTRLDLMEFIGSRGATTKVKLHPETKKVDKCYANIAVRDLREPTIKVEDIVVDDSQDEDQKSFPVRPPTASPECQSASRSTLPQADLSEDSGLSHDVDAYKPFSTEPQHLPLRPAPVEDSPRMDAADSDSQASQDLSQRYTDTHRVDDLVASTERVRTKEKSSVPRDSERQREPFTFTSLETRNKEASKESDLGPRRLLIANPNREKVSACGKTPLISRSSGKKEEEEILQWAKDTLKPYTQIKITNLNSSWRNGLGFCALLHSKYPELIPYEKLKVNNGNLNCQLALSASKFIGVKIPEFDADINSRVVASYLVELSKVLEKEGPALDPDKVKQWQKQWCEDSLQCADNLDNGIKGSEESPVTTEVNRNSDSDKGIPDASETSSTSSATKSRVQELILEAHQKLTLDESDSEPAEINDTAQAISKELKLLELELDRITHERQLMENCIRKGDANDEATRRCIELVNEKNAVVRRQMQLNLSQKENDIIRRQKKIQAEIQRLADIADESKTEAQRQREQNLVQELFTLVNERDEVIMQLDNEEKALHDDATIEAKVKGNVNGAEAKKEECVIQ